MNNKYYIDLHVLTTSLFIILLENNNDIRKVSFQELGKFRKILDEEAKNNDVEFVYLLSRDETIKFFCDNRDTFYHDDDDSIKLRDGITPFHLISDRCYLPLDALLVIISDNVINKTLDMMNLKKTEEPKKEIDYYINELKTRIDEYASNMEYEKCIELRGKFKELLYLEKYFSSNKKKKVLS